MSHFYAFLAAGVIGAAVALYVWLTDESNTPHRNRNRPSAPPKPDTPDSTQSGDTSRPRFFDADPNCIICVERPCSVKFLPCQHSCMCDACTEVYLKYDSKCPMCRSEIERHISV